MYRFSVLYKPYNNLYFKGGVSSNRLDRISGDQLRRNLFNDMGFGVGYAFDEEVFDKSVTDISATKIRKEMREKGDL